MEKIEVRQYGRNTWMAIVHVYSADASYQLRGELPDLSFWLHKNVKGPFHYHTFMLAMGISYWRVFHPEIVYYLMAYSHYIGLISNHGQLEHLTECYGKRDSYCLVERRDLPDRLSLMWRNQDFFANTRLHFPKLGGHYKLVAKFRRVPRKFIRELST